MVRGRGFEPLNPYGTGASRHTGWRGVQSCAPTGDLHAPSLTWLGSGETNIPRLYPRIQVTKHINTRELLACPRGFASGRRQSLKGSLPRSFKKP